MGSNRRQVAAEKNGRSMATSDGKSQGLDQWRNEAEIGRSEGSSGLFLPVVNLTFDQLLAAQSQEQFNQVITQVQQQLSGGAPPNR